MNCKSWRCGKHRKSWLFKWRIVISRELRINPVDKLITLTCADVATPEQLTLARQLFFRNWRKENGSIEYISVLEFTSSTRLPHLHLLARADYFPQTLISQLWSDATLSAQIKASPIVYIERPRQQEAAAQYALSYALNGYEKGQDIPSDWRGRKISYSHGFFKANTTKGHWRAWIRETFGEDRPEDWHVIPKNLTYGELKSLGLDIEIVAQ